MRVATLLLVAALAGCDALTAIRTGPDGLRTFPVAPGLACPAFAAVDPVTGTLRGSQDEREPIYLESADGRRLSVVWPGGFSVRFEPDAVLYDERGEPVAREGAIVELGQINFADAAGTYEDPYIAKGIVFEGCYPSLIGD